MESGVLYKLDKIKVTFKASKELSETKNIDYIKYRIPYF
jgi:hypothetical protein